MNIYVGNLDYKVKENNLKDIFEDYGEVTSAKIITDKYSGKSKGFAFIVMENNKEAKNAIKELNGSKLHDRELIVNEARPKREKFFKN
ncbi:MAG: RNA-binding protein [Bacteroidales bacterium]|nr:RNA-binding protein [Bacteroidales bacterium]